MSAHNETGKAGEEVAQAYLAEKGYKLLAINWHFHHKEIDIIAQKDEVLVFVEVKTRSTLAFELPKEAVTLKKQRHLVSAADAYIRQFDIDLPSRFDIISVLNGEPPRVLEHMQDAFQPYELF